MAHKKPVVQQVEYRVTTAFGDSPLGEVRIAYLIGADQDSAAGLLFHPAKRRAGECASIEMTREGPDGVYMSFNTTKPNGAFNAAALNTVSSVDGDAYINLDKKTQDMYEKLITDAGLKIPRNIIVRQDDAFIEQALRKAPRKRVKR